MHKKTCIIIAFVLSSFVALSQKNKQLEIFVSSFERNYDSRYYYISDTSFFTASLLIVEIGKSFNVSKVYFSDSAPEWQKEQLEKIKGRLRFNELSAYAMQTKFSGKLIFPIIVKSEITKGAVKEEGLIKGNTKFEEAIVLVGGKVLTKKSVENK